MDFFIFSRCNYLLFHELSRGKKIMKEKKKSWFRRHWIISTILGILLLLIIFGMIGSLSENTSDYKAPNELITVSTNSLIPQDSEIDREWIIDPIESISSDSTGFIEGFKRKISKVESFTGTTIVASVYRFDSVANANVFYQQEKQKIDIRGVKEWNLGNNCFGIDQEVLLAGSANGLCLRNNIVFYVESASNSFMYASDGKDVMVSMLKKI